LAIKCRGTLTHIARGRAHLALTKPHYENTRANITYSRLDSRGRGRVKLAAELPLLYTAGRFASRIILSPAAMPANTLASL
jgi:hypothetical protein